MSRVFSMKVRVTSRSEVQGVRGVATPQRHSIRVIQLGALPSREFDFTVPVDFEAPVGAELAVVLGLDPIFDASEIQTSTCGNNSTGSQAGPHPELTADPAGGHPVPT